MTSAITVGRSVSGAILRGWKSIETASETGVAITFCTGMALVPEFRINSFRDFGSLFDGINPKSINSCGQYIPGWEETSTSKGKYKNSAPVVFVFILKVKECKWY